MVVDITFIAGVAKIFLDAAEVDDGSGGVELGGVVNGEDVEGGRCTGGISAIGDAVGQLNGSVVVGVSREGVTAGGVTIDAARVSGIDGRPVTERVSPSRSEKPLRS